MVVLANGLAGNPTITGPGPDYDAFYAALRHVCEYEAKMIASDGEGAGRLITCTVQGAESEEQAELMAKAVVRSPPGEMRHLRHRRQLGPCPLRRGLLRGGL